MRIPVTLYSNSDDVDREWRRGAWKQNSSAGVQPSAGYEPDLPKKEIGVMLLSRSDNMTAPSELHAEALLDFNGTVYRFNGGYEISFEILRVEPSEEIPHGFRYSFVMRGPGDNREVADRILAYDNAHAPSDAKRPHDHLHQTKRGPGGLPVDVQEGVAVRGGSIDELRACS